jgi:superfamily I DNA and/or RNA helicase
MMIVRYNACLENFSLRLPIGSEVLEPPVKAVRVENGYRKEDTRKALNEPEVEAIVQRIYECCIDSKYNGKSFGVISLQGPDQAKLIENLLRDKIGEEEYLNRNIICGDSYSFQGDKRDVIFLSMVAAKSENTRIGALTKRTDSQRFNVAASRARDQMFLFHSVDLKVLTLMTCVIAYFNISLTHIEFKRKLTKSKRTLIHLLKKMYLESSQHVVTESIPRSKW